VATRQAATITQSLQKLNVLSSRITTCHAYVQVVASQYFGSESWLTSECLFGSCSSWPLDLFLQLTQVRLDESPDFVHENVWDDDDLEVSW
jgi:hypothetical protein